MPWKSQMLANLIFLRAIKTCCGKHLQQKKVPWSINKLAVLSTRDRKQRNMAAAMPMATDPTTLFWPSISRVASWSFGWRLGRCGLTSQLLFRYQGRHRGRSPHQLSLQHWTTKVRHLLLPNIQLLCTFRHNPCPDRFLVCSLGILITAQWQQQ